MRLLFVPGAVRNGDGRSAALDERKGMVESVKTPRNTAFERHALASGLLNREQLDQARENLRPFSGGDDRVGPPPADQPLADQLVAMGFLNAWQASQLLEGRTKFSLGPYRIIDGIGRGGMGQVFKAEHAVLGRVVAVKVLPRDKTTPEAIVNFTREIRAQARLDHENLVRAFDAGEDGNVYYLVTEYVPGADLRKLVRQHRRLDMQTAASLISQVAAGLAYAHREGLIHRDVKPGNVLVTPEGKAKLSDLGLAGPLEADAMNDPRFGKIVGTADYLSPDHITAPWDPTPAWDIYSLGCTLYYAVTGKVPFPKGTTRQKAKAHLELRPLDPRRINSSLELEFVELMADMMAKDPAQRIGTADEVIARLARWTDKPAGLGRVAARSVDDAAAADRFSAVDAQDDLDDDLAETQSSFPEIPDSASSTDPSAGQSLETADGLAAATEELSHEPSVQGADSGSDEPLSVLGPLIFLVLLPVGLVGLIALVWWAFRWSR
jgi:serine/threonine protein kinase